MNRKNKKTAAGCLTCLLLAILLEVQVIFVILKLTGTISWSWWAVFAPLLALFEVPIVGIVLAVLILLPGQIAKNMKKRRKIEKEAAEYGMERMPGESDEDLKKRIVRRNMIAGNYSRKDIKDTLLAKFPQLASVRIENDNTAMTVKLKVRRAPTESAAGWRVSHFTEEELREILIEASNYIPSSYKATIEEAKEDSHGNEA